MNKSDMKGIMTDQEQLKQAWFDGYATAIEWILDEIYYKAHNKLAMDQWEASRTHGEIQEEE